MQFGRCQSQIKGFNLYMLSEIYLLNRSSKLKSIVKLPDRNNFFLLIRWLFGILTTLFNYYLE